MFFGKEGIQRGRLFGEDGEPTKDVFDFSQATNADIKLKIATQPDPSVTMEVLAHESVFFCPSLLIYISFLSENNGQSAWDA